jgi:hypothetical protein
MKYRKESAVSGSENGQKKMEKFRDCLIGYTVFYSFSHDTLAN